MSESWGNFAEKAAESMKKSLNSIINDEALDSEQKDGKIGKSVTEFINVVKEFSQEVQKNELHPDVKKALEEAKVLKSQLQEMKKSLEIEQLEFVSKKYEILGKDPKELAKKLYEMKKTSENTYNEYLALLDENVEMTNKSGIFKEFGSDRGGTGIKSQFEQKINEIMKSEPSLTYEQAFVKACDSNLDIKKSVEEGELA